jgi:hypothetical protein
VVLEARHRNPNWNRLVLILLLAPVLVLATIGWRSWRSRRQEYPLIVSFFFGPIGALLAVPVIAVALVFWRYFNAGPRA